MPDEPKEQNPTAKNEEKEQNIHVTVDNKQTELLAKQLAEAQAEKKAMEEKLAKIEAEKKADQEAAKKVSEEAEDLKNKLGIIAEKELEKKRAAVTEQAKALLVDDARVKTITDQLGTLEGIKAMEFTLNTLDKSLKIGQEQAKVDAEVQRKKAEEAAKAAEVAAKAAVESGKPAPAGSAPLNAAQMGNPEPNDFMHQKFESEQAMIRYLHQVENGSDKELAAQAKTALETLIKGWAKLVRDRYDTMRGSPEGGVETPKFQDMMKSKRAQQELQRREQGKQPENV